MTAYVLLFVPENVRNAPRLGSIQYHLSLGSDESCFGEKHAEIGWPESARSIYNKIRPANPQPGGWATHRGEPLKVFDSSLNEIMQGAPGEVLARAEQAVTLAAADGSIDRLWVRMAGPKLPPRLCG